MTERARPSGTPTRPEGRAKRRFVLLVVSPLLCTMQQIKKRGVTIIKAARASSGRRLEGVALSAQSPMKLSDTPCKSHCINIS